MLQQSAPAPVSAIGRACQAVLTILSAKSGHFATITGKRPGAFPPIGGLSFIGAPQRGTFHESHTVARHDPKSRRAHSAAGAGDGRCRPIGGASFAAPADSNPARASPAPGMDPRLEAPIGHRQPNAEDVPASVLHDEGTTNQNQRDLDKKLNVCRGC